MATTQTTLKGEMMRFKVKGINDERDTCDCCGKTGLKKVVWIEDAETLEIRAFGTTCALSPVKAFGIDKEIKAEVRSYESRLKKANHRAVMTYRGERVAVDLNGKTVLKPANDRDFENYRSQFIERYLCIQS